MAIQFMVGFEELIEIASDLSDVNGPSGFLFPGSVDDLFELVEGKHLGNAVRMKTTTSAFAGQIQLNYGIGAWSPATNSDNWHFEFDFKKEVDGVTGATLNGLTSHVLLEVPSGIRLTLNKSTFETTEPGGMQLSVQTSNGSGGFQSLLSPLPTQGQLLANAWYHVKLRVVFSASSGVVELEVTNCFGEKIIDQNLTSVATDPGSFAQQNFRILWLNGLVMDNLVVANDTALFSGERHILTLSPSAVGTLSEWTPTSAGADNYTMVDDNDADNGGALDNNSVAASAADTKDLYEFEDIGAEIGTDQVIEAVQQRSWITEPTVGNGSYTQIYRDDAISAGTNADFATAFTMQGTSKATTRTNNPLDASSWTKAVLNAGEFGLKLVS